MWGHMGLSGLSSANEVIEGMFKYEKHCKV